MIHRVRDLGKQRSDLCLRQLLRERSALPQEMAWLDWIGRQRLSLHHEVLKKVFDGMEPSVDRGRSQVGLVLLLNEVLKVTPGHRTQCLGERREKQAEIPPIILDGVRRIVARMQVRTE